MRRRRAFICWRAIGRPCSEAARRWDMAVNAATATRSGWGTTATLVMVAGAIVISTGLGIRQTFGMFLQPFSADRALPITVFAFAVALHTLVWGIIQPLAGAASDLFGTVVVVAVGAVVYAAGLALTAFAHDSLV